MFSKDCVRRMFKYEWIVVNIGFGEKIYLLYTCNPGDAVKINLWYFKKILT